MNEVAFFEVAPHEREAIGAAAFPGYGVRIRPEPLGPATASLAPEAEVVSIFIYSTITAEVLDQLPRLRLVVTRSTGYNHIDLAECRRRGVTVSFVPSYGENTVAEHAFALILALARHLQTAIAKTRRLDFSLEGLEGLDLQGKTLGVVGAGRIGRHAIRIARGFGMEAIAHDPHEDAAQAEREGYRYVTLEELLRRADVVSIHAALVPQTYHLIGREQLRLMKPTALLINTARGGIVDSEALCEALTKGWIAGAGLDVFEGEELIKDEAELLHRDLSQAQVRQLAFCHALLRHENVIMTPHSAFLTREGVQRLVSTSLENIRAFLAGHPQNLVG